MISDILQNALSYNLNRRLNKALKWLITTDLTELKADGCQIEKNKIFVVIKEYQTKQLAECKWEAHKKFIDIQLLLSGSEQIAYADINDLEIGEYIEEKDFLALKGKGKLLTLTPGMFAIFWPQDGHMPGIAINDSPEKVKKLVIKVAV